MRRRATRRHALSPIDRLEARRLLTTLIALVDTGVDLSSTVDQPYYDLADAYNAYTQQTAAQAGPGVVQDTDSAGNPTHGHGSTVADSIVAGIQTAASQPGGSGASVEILPIKASGPNGNLDEDAVIRGIQYAVAHGASVINLSLNQGFESPQLLAAIQQAAAAAPGAVVVTAAGNNGFLDSSPNGGVNIDSPPLPLYPAYDHTANMIVVAATDASGNLQPSSNWGPVHVDLGAPGAETSYAAGYTSGIVGVLAALAPSWSATQLDSYVKQTVAPDFGLAGKTTTGGLLDPANAIHGIVDPTGSFAIDSGGGAAGSFFADNDVNGGFVNSPTTHAIDTSGLADPVPQAVLQSERYGSFTYTIPDLTPGAAYTVKLFFSENYYNGPGQRLFNVAINGTPDLINFDIYATAGGMDKAVEESFATTADPAGMITIAFTGNAKSSGIEIVPATAGPTPAAPAVTPIVAINAGGAAGSYIGDADVTGGSITSTSQTIDTSGVSDPAPQSVYQTERYGDFTYTIPNLNPGSTYLVRLHFAEIYFDSPGQRLFNVAINDVPVLSDFDILAAAGGKDKAIVEPFLATANAQGTITIAFTSVVNGAKVSGIEIEPATSPDLVALNAGGSASGVFGDDADVAGGTVVTTTNPIATASVASPAPQAVYQSARVGNFAYTIPNLAPGATYAILLHFADFVDSAAGQRVFTVTANGTPALTNFDPVASAGAPNQAVVEAFETTADLNGTIVLGFNGPQGAIVNGIEVRPTAPAHTVAIDAGGSAADPYVADTDASGGFVTSTTHAIDTSGITDPPPQSVLQTERYGTFTYTIPKLNPGESYTVRLLFSENYFDTPGQRYLSVAINGTSVLTNFDILAATGAKFKAIAESFPVTVDPSGQVTIAFTSTRNGAKVDGIEVIPTGFNGIAIDSGGPAAGPFLPDADVSGGNLSWTTHAIDTSGLADPVPQAVLQTQRYGNFTYTIPDLTPGAAYTVKLLFSENYYNGPGQRLFNVAINGSPALTNFDIDTTAGGMYKAIEESFAATADGSGTITIAYSGNAVSSGIEVVPGVSPGVRSVAPALGAATPSGTLQALVSGGGSRSIPAPTNASDPASVSAVPTSGADPAPAAVVSVGRPGTLRGFGSVPASLIRTLERGLFHRRPLFHQLRPAHREITALVSHRSLVERSR